MPQNFQDGKFVAQKPVFIDCIRCDATGFIEPDQLIREAAEDACWCKCEEPHDDNFHDDGDTQVYGDGFVVEKHHWSCSNCGLITQVG